MVTSTDFQLDKDQLSRIGNGIFSYRSSAISADTEVTGLIHGASDHQGVAADSLIISNIIDGGDVAIHVLNGNDSYEALLADASARILYLGHGMNSVNVNADVIFPEASTISTTAGALTLSPATDTLLADGTGLVIGHTAKVNAGSQANEIQIIGTGQPDTRMTMLSYHTGNLVDNAAGIDFVKSTGGTAGTVNDAVVADDEVLGQLAFFGSDGTDLNTRAAQFYVEVDDASPAAGDIGTAFVWSQMPGGGGALAETMRLSATGKLTLALSDLELSAGNLLIADGYGAVIGATTQLGGMGSNTTAPEMQVLGTSGPDASIGVARFSADESEGKFVFVKSRNGAIGSNAKVLNNDIIGAIEWAPDDGQDFKTLAARFKAEVDDASPATGDIGMAFVWEQMPGGGGAIAETMRLSAAGALTLSVSADSAAVADQVSFGRYEIGAANTVIALSQETAVAAENDETKFSHKVQMRINGATYFVMLTDS